MEIHDIVRWSAWPSLLCYSVAAGMRFGPRPGDWRVPTRRLLAVGWSLLAIHILIAMGTVHHWSLSEAYLHTAERTVAATGWNSGAGVWFNFATLAIWGLLLFPSPVRIEPPPLLHQRLEIAAHAYLLFMMFNATVVFGTRAAQIMGALIGVCLIWRCCTPESPR